MFAKFEMVTFFIVAIIKRCFEAGTYIHAYICFEGYLDFLNIQLPNKF